MNTDEINKMMFDLLAKQGEELSDQGKVLARLEQGQQDLHTRLFGGGQPGVIQYLAAADTKAATDHLELKATVDSILTQRTGDKRWLRGVLWLGASEVAFIGFYFKYLHDAFAPLLAALAKR
jgi:hypothetical protein